MTSLVPREPYSQEELHKLYPKGLQLQLVQVFLRHGNSSLSSPVPVFSGPFRSFISESTSSHPGELTDEGRQSTYALGQRLRYLYIDQLGFMPSIRSGTEDMYLRTTPIPRALESLQQVFWGMYPPEARTANFARPTIVARSPAEETLFPNESNCHRFRQLARLFAQRAADRWNDSEQMEYLNSVWSKWMPEGSRVAVDSRPRLSGIMDTINATLAHGPGTRLPSEFYDPKAREYCDKIATDEWFAGYKESNEYRKLGIGALVGDVVDRMVSASVDGGWRPTTNSTKNEVDAAVKFALSGCHDTTIAALLHSLGAFDGEKWPPYTSSIAFELFKDVDGRHATKPGDILEELSVPDTESLPPKKKSSSSLMSKLFGGKSSPEHPIPSETARTSVSELPPLRNHYVRIRYNDRPVRIPGCAAKPGNHLPGDDTFCTLEAFKKIADKFTPRNWQAECGQNLDKGMFAEGDDLSGY
ncbi:hypothetical protein FQN51_005387 [Onygenales sp. PD_10]|nr:hypothetical protein FQN51_005387 [Onygenales sp. PD_10]